VIRIQPAVVEVPSLVRCTQSDHCLTPFNKDLDALTLK
jgi:hypothetical protein